VTARFSTTRSAARPLCDSWASCCLFDWQYFIQFCIKTSKKRDRAGKDNHQCCLPIIQRQWQSHV